MAGPARFLEEEHVEQPVPREVWIPALAKRIITAHRDVGHCNKCRTGSMETCETLSWARSRLRAFRTASGGTDQP
ncbi:hypothetical protein GCM10027605_56610 [Micromonospora zhanjiangensis]